MKKVQKAKTQECQIILDIRTKREIGDVLLAKTLKREILWDKNIFENSYQLKSDPYVFRIWFSDKRKEYIKNQEIGEAFIDVYFRKELLPFGPVHGEAVDRLWIYLKGTKDVSVSDVLDFVKNLGN